MKHQKKIVEQDWLEMEINKLNKEIRESINNKKYYRDYDNTILFTSLFFMLLLSFFTLSAHETFSCPCETEFFDEVYSSSAQWRCRRCNHWNYSECPDWKGDYYCINCGTRMGDQ